MKKINKYNKNCPETISHVENQKLKAISWSEETSNIPKRYQNASIIPINDSQIILKKQIKDNLDTSTLITDEYGNVSLIDFNNIVINGNIGVGKTYLTIGLIKYLISLGVGCKYTTQYDLIGLKQNKEYQAFDNFKKINILVIDELAKTELASWQVEHLEELLSWRHNEMLPTILITNHSPSKFAEFIGSRIISRLRETKTIITALTGQDLRAGN